MRKAFIYLIIVALFSVLFFSCGIKPVSSGGISMEFKDADQYIILGFEKGKMVLQTVETESILYSFDLENNVKTELGRIDHYAFSTASRAYDAGKVYEVLRIAEADGEASNVLYEIDYRNNTVTPLSSDRGYSPLVYLYKEKRGVLQLKTPKIGASETTFFELYDTTTAESRKVLAAGEDEIYTIASVYENCLYVLSDHVVPDTDSEFSLKVFDMDTYELKNEIDLEEIYDYLIRARIGQMEVFGDYILFENYSNEGAIYKISNGNITAVVERDHLKYVSNSQQALHGKEGLFYVYKTAECFTFNFETGEIRTVDPKLHDDNYIKSILSDGEQILLVESKSSESKLFKPKTILNLYNYGDFIN